jgi:hypothetical protein
MSIAEIKANKQKLNEDIKEAVSKLIFDFVKDNDVIINSININPYYITLGMGAKVSTRIEVETNLEQI